MLGEPTTLASLGTAMRMVMEERGVDSAKFFAELGIDPALFGDHEARVPLSLANRAWQRLIEITADPTIGLDMVRHNRPTLSHALGQSLMASASIADAVARLQRYDRVVTTGTEVEMEQGPGYVDLWLRFPHEHIHPTAQARDCMLASLTMRFRNLAGEDFAPLQVTLVHPDHGRPERYRDFFRCPVLFDAPRDSLRIDATALHKPNAFANPMIAAEIDKISEQYLRRIDTPPISHRVRRLIQQGLPSGELSQDEIARRLNRSISALSEGTSYKALLEQTREQLAKAYLSEGEHSLAQVSYLLGFSDQANFTRAFKRWTGSTPTEFAD